MYNLLLVLAMLAQLLGTPAMSQAPSAEKVLASIASVPGEAFNGLAVSPEAVAVGVAHRNAFPNRTAFEAAQIGGQLRAFAEGTPSGVSLAINTISWGAVPYWWGWLDTPRWSGRTAGKTWPQMALSFGFLRGDKEELVGAWRGANTGGACLFLVEENLGSCVQEQRNNGLVELPIPPGTGHILVFVWAGNYNSYIIGEPKRQN